jgi:hypothetical protein
MKNAQSILIGTGSFVLAGSILTMFAPRAAHALAATLAQATNTAANPAITESANAPKRSRPRLLLMERWARTQPLYR